MWTVTATSRQEGRKCRGLQSLHANLWIRPRRLGRTMSESVIVFFLLFLHLIHPAMTEPTTQCPEYTYYDHGTHHCEMCYEICDKALHFKTEDQCLELCPAYAKIIWPPKPENPQPPLPAVTVKPDKLPSAQQPQPGNAGDNSLGLTVGIPLGVLAALMVPIGIVIHCKMKRKASRRLPDVENAVPQPEADRMIPLTADRPWQTDDVSLGPAAAGRGGTVAGVQEQGELTTTLNELLLGDLRRSQQSSMDSGCSPVPSTPVSPPGAQGGDSPRKPVQVLDQSGATEMVLNCNRSSPPRYMSQGGLDCDRSQSGLGLDRSLTDEEEYHSTEVKTSDYSTSSLLGSGEGGGGLSTNYQ